jgi:RNA polymerase sigma-54 factor
LSVHLNERFIPRLVVLEASQVGHHVPQKAFKGYIAHARWLMKALTLRRQNLLKVAHALVDYQQGFFQEGLSALKPMTLSAIAIETGLHESTVSRLTQGKYMNTPQGTFDMRYFFSSAVPSHETGEEASSHVIQLALKQAIQEENPHKPLSDADLVALLTAKGLPAARRTITKYRESLKIPSSFERRKGYKRNFHA